MGKTLATNFAVARELFEEADEALGFRLSKLSWEGPEAELTETRNAQPAILTHSVAAYRVVQEELGNVCAAAGHSLGEFSAHVAAGTLPFNQAVDLVRLRGQLMFETGVQRPGTMSAVLGLADEVVDEVCRSVSAEGSVVVPANFNTPGQVVVSGDEDAVERVTPALHEAGAKKVVPLKVSGAFHSPLMEPAAPGLESRLARIEVSDPSFPVISNVTAVPVEGADAVRGLLVRQVTSAVRWAESIGRMVALGAERFVELGPGSVLTGLNRRNARGVPSLAVGSAEDVDALREDDSG
jgi:[acyl-carrier-protein] S-malonyltransferase